MKLARVGKLPHIVLPDGEIRFDEAEIDRLLTTSAAASPRAESEELEVASAS